MTMPMTLHVLREIRFFAIKCDGYVCTQRIYTQSTEYIEDRAQTHWNWMMRCLNGDGDGNAGNDGVPK